LFDRIRSDNGVPFASTDVGGLSALSLSRIQLGITPDVESRGLDPAAALDHNLMFSLATMCFEVSTGIFADRYGRAK
jgi:hypothetical protein